MCGASTTQPVCPVQCCTSRPASFSGRYGSPPLPKMLSTKSRLLTRLPGAMKRISMVFAGSLPGGRTNQRPQQQRDEAARRLLPVRRERQRQQILGRLQGRGPQCRERLLGHRRLVGRNRKPALGDVKQPLRGAPVAARIVQHALRQAVGIQVWRREGIAPSPAATRRAPCPRGPARTCSPAAAPRLAGTRR